MRTLVAAYRSGTLFSTLTPSDASSTVTQHAFTQQGQYTCTTTTPHFVGDLPVRRALPHLGSKHHTNLVHISQSHIQTMQHLLLPYTHLICGLPQRHALQHLDPQPQQGARRGGHVANAVDEALGVNQHHAADQLQGIGADASEGAWVARKVVKPTCLPAALPQSSGIGRSWHLYMYLCMLSSKCITVPRRPRSTSCPKG